jgi:dienelactone hydrolase
VVALGEELTAAGADWQIHAYGGTMHALMAVGANRPEAGIQYNERSARRAWRSWPKRSATASRADELDDTGSAEMRPLG